MLARPGFVSLAASFLLAAAMSAQSRGKAGGPPKFESELVFDDGFANEVWVVTADPLMFEVIVAFRHVLMDGVATAVEIARWFDELHEGAEPPAQSREWLRREALPPARIALFEQRWAKLGAGARTAAGAWLDAADAVYGPCESRRVGLLAQRIRGGSAGLDDPTLFPAFDDHLRGWVADGGEPDARAWEPTRASVRRLCTEIVRESDAAGLHHRNDIRAAVWLAWARCAESALAVADAELADIRLGNALAHLVLLRAVERRSFVDPRVLGGRTGFDPKPVVQEVVLAFDEEEITALRAAAERLTAYARSGDGVRRAIREAGGRAATEEWAPRKPADLLQRLSLFDDLLARARAESTRTLGLVVDDPLYLRLRSWRLHQIALGPPIWLDPDDDDETGETLALDPAQPGVRHPAARVVWQPGRPGALLWGEPRKRTYTHLVTPAGEDAPLLAQWRADDRGARQARR